MILCLSYPLKKSSPLYPGTPPLTILRHKNIGQGDSANTSVISLSSHSGTHIDAPSHFCQSGSPVSEILHEKNIFFPAYCIPVEKGVDECITVEDIAPFVLRFSDAKALLIRTGWSEIRDTDPGSYALNHPFVHPDVPEFIRASCEDIALFGIDTLSVSNPHFRNEGRACHRAFLCENPPIPILEDINLSREELIKERFSLVFYPWIIEPMDGVPVMVFAEFNDYISGS